MIRAETRYTANPADPRSGGRHHAVTAFDQREPDMTWHLPDPERQPEFYRDVPLKRLLAFLIDTVAILVLSLIGVVLTAFTALFFFPFLFAAIGFAYRAITIARRSATPGMQVMAIEFRTMSGARFDTSMALMHTVGLTVSFMVPILQIVSMGFMAFGARGQGLTDMALGTVALNRRAAS